MVSLSRNHQLQPMVPCLPERHQINFRICAARKQEDRQQEMLCGRWNKMRGLGLAHRRW